ncbi:type II/IV secretion system protein [Candidatus Peregrinibacteria bacterium]|nr:type II/IV secretion system protein [Candidatus Peregrinibacteria bacterium]
MPQAATVTAPDEWKVRHITKDPGDYGEETNKKILDYFVKLELISKEQAAHVRDIHGRKGGDLTAMIQEEKLLKEDEIGRAMADFFNCQYVSLKEVKVEFGALHILPQSVAESEMAVVFREDDEGAHLAAVNPMDLHFLHLLEKKTGKKVKIYYASPRQVRMALKHYQDRSREGVERLIERATENISHLESLNNISSIFDTLILMAYDRGASDIHIEPFEGSIRIRFRVDGMLVSVATLPIRFLETMVNHVKVLARLRIDEHQSAQDGRFNVSYGDTRIHLRVSVMPTHFGEKTVLRLLPMEAQELTLATLGYLAPDEKIIEKSLRQPNGIILVTGPTGSGKTTTLYCLLKRLNKEGINISTIEDPIEYGIEGINQSQVNPKTNITFAEGLKSLLRQDPDILMIGEVRDEETAKIAMHSALTGHLVLSTLHTNSASLAPLRLVQMGVDPYLITSTVNLIIAQRLVRKICPHCMTSFKLTKKEIADYESQFPLDEEGRELFGRYFSKAGDSMRLFKGKGCRKCGGTGYRGRTVVAEVLKVKKNIQELILKQASESDIREAAKKNGMTSMLDDGFQKVLQGSTTLDELFRVINQ